MSTHLRTIIFVIGVMLGIVCDEIFKFSTECAVMALFIFLIQSLILILGKKKQIRSKAPIFILFLFSGLFLGIIRTQVVSEKLNYICESVCTFEAKIVTSPEIKNDYQTFNIYSNDKGDEVLDISVNTLLYPKYKIGETIRVSGKVFLPNYINQHGDKKSFDYASYLLNQNVGSEMLFPKIEVLDEDAHTLNDYLGRWKDNMVEKLKSNISSPQSDLAAGMLFGESGLSKDLNQSFKVAGLSHIIVLSGFNIAIVISFVLFVFAFLPLTIRIFIASVCVIFFVMMVGGGESVVRATIMAFIALISTLLGREYFAKQALIISLLLILLYDPYSLLHSVSLHLSFLATAGIIYLNDNIFFIVKKLFNKYFSLLNNESFLEIFSTTLSAYFTTLPYLMYTFGSFSLYALLANILVLPFVPFAMMLSFLVFCFSYISNFCALVFGFIDNLIIGFMVSIARIIESLPYSYIGFQISFLEMCIMYLFIFYLIYFLYKSLKNETQTTNAGEILTDIISY